MQELLGWLEHIEDDRQQRKVRHTLKDTLVIVLLTTLVNADGQVKMALFAENYQDYFREYIESENGIPSHNTIRRVMEVISLEILQQLYGKRQDRLNRDDGELLEKIICIGGKTMRSSKGGTGKVAHIVSVWSKEGGFCLGRKTIKEKSNEIVAVPGLSDKIRIKGQTVMIDAMGAQAVTTEKVEKKRVDYVLTLKKNQNSLYEDVQEYFLDEKLRKRICMNDSCKKTQEKAHDQVEIKEYYQTEDAKWLSQEKNWKGLSSIVMEKKMIEKDGKRRIEYRHFISSLKTDVEQISRVVGGHWSTEGTRQHLNVTFREDANITLDKMAAQNLNIIREWNLSILKPAQMIRHELSARRKRFVVSMRPIRYLEELLEAQRQLKTELVIDNHSYVCRAFRFFYRSTMHIGQKNKKG